ncbi:hypothetical protein NQ314_020448 [Rhamnusium bicolor]|uniref:Uncharacterized protein n=1 Tax=Rhamnusium bicolor TaxID=1586634 RepID=A0AAV8WLK9_9CUCU|nr:hypothetical protein NQ314_020448 [Rhamnusium bicolor]
MSNLTIKKNSSILLNGKNKINIVTTKGPFRIKVNKITTKTTLKTKYKATTPAPIVIKLTRLTTQKPKTTTRGYTVRPTRKHIRNKTTRPNVNTSSSYKQKLKPTVHRITTKWSDSPDISEIKQNWYEDGVPYPNPNPEISSFSPPVSLSSISPLSTDFVDNVNYPNLNPEISSFSPPISLGDLSSISPLSNDFVDNANYPSPMPEVSSYSPSYSISDVPSIAQDVPEIPDLPSSTPGSTTAVSNPINVFNLDMVPDRTKQASGNGSPCPEVHISSSVLSRQQRQDCSDLNLVINSHFHQNQNGGGTRNPAISTYDAPEEVAEDPLVDAGEGVGSAADPGVGSAADPGVGTAGNAGTVNADSGGGVANTAGTQAAAPPAGGTGGTGGTGGAGDDGGGGLKFPDLKNLFDAIGYLWNKLGHLLSFLKNPYLYIVPIVFFFTVGFLTILALFPWWIPLLVLYLGIKSHKKPKDTVSFYKHVHKPIHHADGWFWNHQTKTWQNVQDFAHTKRVDGDKRIDDISKLIKNIRNKYANNNTSVQSWKRRRKPK